MSPSFYGTFQSDRVVPSVKRYVLRISWRRTDGVSLLLLANLKNPGEESPRQSFVSTL